MHKQSLTLLILLCTSLIILSPSTGLHTADTSVELSIVPYSDVQFTNPTDIQFSSDDGSMFVLEQAGRVIRVQNSTAEVVLDIRSTVKSSGNEQGLLGLALHPSFSSNGRIYLDYTVDEGGEKTVIAEYIMENGSVDNSTERRLLEVPQPYSNHNAGAIAFGPDGYLYITLGDGGSAGDPQNNGQDPSTLLGSILRIEVDNQDSGMEYAIPQDNPFVGQEGADEIYAYGFRNPWRISFDTVSGILFAGDVGQSEIEEIDIVEMGQNYGWNIMEGSQCYNADSCNTNDLKLPVAEYSHDQGISVTGGYVSGSEDVESLQGYYIFADFGSGKIWKMEVNPPFDGTYELVADTDYHITTFGLNAEQKIYFADRGGQILTFQENVVTDSTATQTISSNPFDEDTSSTTSTTTEPSSSSVEISVKHLSVLALMPLLVTIRRAKF